MSTRSLRSSMSMSIIVAVGLLAQAAYAEKVYFEAKSGDASNVANWSAGRLPASGDTLCMTNAAANEMLVRPGDVLSVGNLSICRNNNDSVKNKQVILQSGGSVSTTGGASYFATWPNDTSEYRLSDGLLSFAGSSDNVHFCGRGIGNVRVDGGELRVNGGYPRIVGYSGNGALDVRGGVVNVTNVAFYVSGQESGRGALNVGGSGTFRVFNKNIAASSDSSAPTSLLNLLSGGMISCMGLVNPKGCTTYYSFAGGTIVPNMTAMVNAGFVTNVNVAVNAGGVTIDSGDRHVTVHPGLSKGNLRKENLYRRWSFTDGSLVDSVEGVEGVAVGGVAFADGKAILPGTSSSSGGGDYVALQRGGAVLPIDNEDGFTIELWASARAIRAYQPVFRIWSGSKDNSFSPHWNKDAGTGGAASQVSMWIGGTWYMLDGGINNWETNDMCHLTYVFSRQANGTWNLTARRSDARSGILYASATKTSLPSTFSPSLYNANSSDFSLGLSCEANFDAAASYDEVRVWNRPLTDLEIAASAAMGPDADFENDNGLTKCGQGVLTLAGQNTYAGSTAVSAGSLSLGSQSPRPTHRWSFNGDLSDSCGAFTFLGRKDAAKYGSNSANITFDADGKYVSIPGGNNGTAYLNLVPSYGGVFDAASWERGITLELWVREDADMGGWARIFDIHNNTAHQNFMSWNKRLYMSQSTTQRSVAGTYADFDIGTWYHVGVVYSPAADGWHGTVYVHNAETGDYIGSSTLVGPENWTPRAIYNSDFTLAKSASGDKDAAASYDEVRVWERAFSQAELRNNVRLGPDTLPSFGSSAANAGSLPPTTDLTIAQGSVLELSGTAQTVNTLTCSGVVNGRGSLTVTVAILPGEDGTGAMTLAGGAVLVGEMAVAADGAGNCGRIELFPEYGVSYDLSGIRMTVDDEECFVPGVKHGVLFLNGAEVSEWPDMSGLPADMRFRCCDGRLEIWRPSGMSIIIY
ncbi:MAG: autotransporter-associated beta strand repeat-containing protein [Kiritimatiellae bacterium]|nr:autotransporter-associated beta strand repeat-containing protein [Kiritimatiellia bacterium]